MLLRFVVVYLLSNMKYLAFFISFTETYEEQSLEMHFNIMVLNSFTGMHQIIQLQDQ